MTLTAEQLADRHKGVGGSDCSVVLGLNPWQTPLDLWREKRQEVPPADLSDNEAVHFGNVLEDTVAKEYMRRTGRKVRRKGTVWSKEYPFMFVNIDRDILNLDGILECKTTSAFNKDQWGEEGSDNLPMAYICQAQHSMAVTGAAFVDVAVLIGGQKYQAYTVKRNADLIDEIIKREAIFWGQVQAGNPPEPVNLDDIRSLYPKDEGTIMQATQDVYDQVVALHTLNGEIKSKKVEADELKKEIQAYMKESATLEYGGTAIVSWRSNTKDKLDTKALKEAHGPLVQEFTKEAVERRFLVKKGAVQ